MLKGVADGLSNKLIAENLGINPQAMETHRTDLMGRIGAKNLPELVRLIMRVDLVGGSGEY